MNNPFDMDNYQRQIDWSKTHQAYKNSVQQTAVVNDRRAKGEEPSQPYSAKGRDTEPGKFAVDMPVMPKYVRPSRRKKMTDCKHEWLTLADQPLYKCNECGTFMRIIK